MTIVRTRINQAALDTAIASTIFLFLNDLIADAGWRVKGSGDASGAFENEGQTAGSTGTGVGGGFDVIVAASDLDNFNGLGNDSSWRRYATPPDAPVQAEFIIQRGSTEDRWRIEFGPPGATFSTGGATGAAPSLASGTSICMGGNQVRASAANDYAFMIPSLVAESRCAWHIGDAADNYDFVFWCWRFDGNQRGLGYSAFGRFRLNIPWFGSVADGPDDDPYVWCGILHTSGGATVGLWDNSGWMFNVNNLVVTPARLEDRTGINGPGWYASYALNETGPPATAGHYFVALTARAGHGSLLTEKAYSGDVAGRGLKNDAVTGEEPIFYDIGVARTDDGGVTVGPRFSKGYLATRDIIALSGAFEVGTANGGGDQTLHDSDRSRPRRMHSGFMSLLWVNGAQMEIGVV